MKTVKEIQITEGLEKIKQYAHKPFKMGLLCHYLRSKGLDQNGDRFTDPNNTAIAFKVLQDRIIVLENVSGNTRGIARFSFNHNADYNNKMMGNLQQLEEAWNNLPCGQAPEIVQANKEAEKCQAHLNYLRLTRF